MFQGIGGKWMKKKRITKRARLIALLSALAALASGGIGAGAAFSAMAASTTGQSSASRSYPSSAKAGKTRPVLASSPHSTPDSTPAVLQAVYHSSQAFNTFLSSVVPQNQYSMGGRNFTDWSGSTVKASVTLGDGTNLPIASPIGLWNGSSLVNPNSLTPGQIEEYMLNGYYMGNIGAGINQNGSIGQVIPFLGEVDFQGNPNTSMENFINGGSDWWIGSSNISSTSLLYDFQTQCINNNMLSNPYFALMASKTKDELTGLLQGLLFGSNGLYTTDQKYYGQIPDAGVEKDLATLKSEGQQLIGDIGYYQAAMEAWNKAGGSSNSSAAKSAYEKALGSAKSTQPLLCLAVWDQNVGYASFPSNETLYNLGSANPPSMYWGTYMGWGWGPSYVGTANPADSKLSMNISSTGTQFIYDVMAGLNKNYNPDTDGIFLQAMYVANENSPSSVFSEGGSSSVVNISWTKGGNTRNLQSSILLRSLGFAGEVNPTSLPQGTTLSPSSPASVGLWFKAYDQSGEPLKSAKIDLSLLTGTDQSPSSVFGDYLAIGTSSAPSGVTSQMWPNMGKEFWYTNLQNSPMPFEISSLSSQPGYFDLSGIPNGVYQVKILSGTTESGKSVSYGSYYTAPTFKVNLNDSSSYNLFDTSYTSPEAVSAVSDPCGFVNPSEDEVVVGAVNPSSAEVTGTSLSTSPFTATVGSSNPYTYQAQAYLPFNLSGKKNSSGTASSSTPLSFSLSIPGQSVVSGSEKVNGLALSSLQGASSSVSGSTLTLSLTPQNISTIESKGEMPIGSSSGSLTQNGQVNRTLAITWEAYLTPSFTSSSSSTFEFNYKAYDATNPKDMTMALTPEVETNGPADNSVPSALSPTQNSSKTGLWFKSLNADGTSSSGAKFTVQNSSGQYLEEVKGTDGSFEGWKWVSSSSPANFEFSYNQNSNSDTGLFSFGGLQNGTYTVTLRAWPSSMGTPASTPDTGKNNWPSISPSNSGAQNPNAGYPGEVTDNSGYKGSFTVDLSYSSPEKMSTVADPAGLVDSAKDSMYSLSPVKMAPVEGGKLSTQAYQTETVGVPFTEGWEGYLPMATVEPGTSAGGNGYASEIDVAFAKSDSGLQNWGNSSGLKMNNPSPSNVMVAGVSLQTLESEGATVNPSADGGNGYQISIPYQALSYLQAHGTNAEGQSLSSSSNRLILITFPAVMTTNFSAEGGNFQQWMSMGTNGGWWIQSQHWGVYSSPLYTNGPADNSVPSNLSPSENSSETGIWFKSLWYNTSTPAPGSKYTVKNASGEYLTPQESNGAFSGWSWQSSPYEFTEKNDSAVFSFGGLADGEYTLTQVSPATGATASTLTFTSTLSYSSPESLKAVKDSLNLLDSSKDTVWAIVVPSSLPLTGGKMVLLVSLSAVTLFGAGAAFFILRKRRRA